MQKNRPYRPIIFTILLLFASQFVSAQSPTELGFSEFMDLVKSYHPVSVQAGLRPASGEAMYLASKGAFDPKIGADLSQKRFESKEYYSLGTTSLSLPTNFAASFDAGYERNAGIFLNPESNVPNEGLFYGGLSLPLVRGLMIDSRRAEFRKARLFRDGTEWERQVILNSLYYEAGVSYWNWFLSYNVKLIYADALNVALDRLEAVKERAQLGDRPFIDTVEASIQYQNRLLNYQQADVDYKNQTLMLANYLWAEDFVPLDIPSSTSPQEFKDVDPSTVDLVSVSARLDSLILLHPELRLSQNKIQSLEIDRKLSQEQLKPQLDIKYQALANAGGNPSEMNFISNNYNWGFKFGIPLFLRKERGKLKMTKLKIKESELELSFKQQVMSAKAQVVVNEWQTSIEQLRTYRKTVIYYDALLAGERELFEAGESSLFLVNRRELGFINAQIKLVELISKNQKNALSIDFNLGDLYKL